MNLNIDSSSAPTNTSVAGEPTETCPPLQNPAEASRQVIDLSASFLTKRSEAPSSEISLTQIRRSFIDYFVGHGYREEPPAKLSSGIDPTVIFVGSNINGLKKYILSEIPADGVVIDQQAMRFRELPRLFDPTYRPVYGTFFNEIGAIVRPTASKELTQQLHEFLSRTLSFSDRDIVARASTKDPDLLELARGIFPRLELDSKPDNYYRHSIGEPGFQGRNFNIALKNTKTGTFDDIGNVIAFQRDGKDVFFEIALGDTVILKAMRGLDHVIDCYDIKLPPHLDRIEALNFKNAIIVATVLYREGLRVSNRNNQEKILSKYARYLSLLRCAKDFGGDDIGNAIATFEASYYGKRSGIEKELLIDLEKKEPIFRKSPWSPAKGTRPNE
jgi:hypothetical protein